MAGLSIASGDGNDRDLRGVVRADQDAGQNCELTGECKGLLGQHLELPRGGNRRLRASWRGKRRRRWASPRRSLAGGHSAKEDYFPGRRQGSSPSSMSKTSGMPPEVVC